MSEPTGKPKRCLIEVDKLNFYYAEAEQVHEMCTRAGVPEELDGFELSMAERVLILETNLRDLLVKYLKAKPVDFH